MKQLPTDSYPALIELVNETYAEQIEEIIEAGVDASGNIICVAQDGERQISIEIADGGIKTELYDPSAKFSAPKPDTSSQIATNLQKLGDPIVSGWLRQIEQVLATSDDLETAREALFQLYPDLDSTELTEQMTDATALASMAGFWEAGKPTPTVPEAQSPLPGGDLGDEAEFAKIPEGTKRRRGGVDYELRDSRWHKAEVQSETQKKNPSTSEIPQSMS
jgi:hypothetical protein